MSEDESGLPLTEGEARARLAASLRQVVGGAPLTLAGVEAKLAAFEVSAAAIRTAPEGAALQAEIEGFSEQIRLARNHATQMFDRCTRRLVRLCAVPAWHAAADKPAVIVQRGDGDPEVYVLLGRGTRDLISFADREDAADQDWRSYQGIDETPRRGYTILNREAVRNGTAPLCGPCPHPSEDGGAAWAARCAEIIKAHSEGGGNG